MITLQMSFNGAIEIRSVDRSPSVYLDHWAFRNISEDQSRRESFIKILKEKDGTLCISWLNLIEFAKVDPSQQKLAESFVDEVLPNVVFLKSDPFFVIDRENDFINGGAQILPHIDAEFGKSLLTGGAKSIKLLSADSLFQLAACPKLLESRKNIANTVIERIEKLRYQFATNSEFANRVDTFIYHDTALRGTPLLIREMIRSLLKNSKLIMTENHAFDLMHTVVPVSYCDFVLLDSHWTTQIEQARKRMEKDGVLKFPMAKVYSQKNDGIASFVSDLKNYTVPSTNLKQAV